MGPSRRSRSSGPREAFQPPAGPSAPAWRPVGWVAGLDATAGGCRVHTWVLWAGARGVQMRPVPCVACPPSLLGVSRLLPSAAATAPEKCLLGVAEGLSLLAAGPRGVSGTRPQVRDLGPCADASCGWGGVLGPPGPRAPGTEWDPPPVPPLAGGLGRELEKQPCTQRVPEGQLGRAQISAWGQSCKLVSPRVGRHSGTEPDGVPRCSLCGPPPQAFSRGVWGPPCRSRQEAPPPWRRRGSPAPVLSLSHGTSPASVCRGPAARASAHDGHQPGDSG